MSTPLPPSSPNANTGNKSAWILGILFVLALLMGPGPGLLLVNTPNSILGLPALYAWGVLWFFVEATVVVLAFVLVWRTDAES